MSTLVKLNDRPFRHLAHHGTTIKATRCDFGDGYELFRPASITDEQFASDVAEIFHWHAMNICPDLNGYCFGWCLKVHKLPSPPPSRADGEGGEGE